MRTSARSWNTGFVLGGGSMIAWSWSDGDGCGGGDGDLEFSAVW